MKNFKINDEVERVQPGDYTNGRIGTVLSVDIIKLRCKIDWHSCRTLKGIDKDKNPKTWVSFKSLDLFTDDKFKTLRFLIAQRDTLISYSKNEKRYSKGYRDDAIRRANDFQSKIDELN